MVGSAITRNLKDNGYINLVYSQFPPYDLMDQGIVAAFFEKEKPEYVFLAAAKVGGIMSNNTYRAQFLYENLMIQNNIIHQSYLHGVNKLLFLGSSCIYPKNCPQPIKEEYLLTNELEYTNEPYAIAKIAGIKMCESYNIQYGTNFLSVMPTNLYGPNDNYNLSTSHVLPAMIRKMHLGKCLENNDWDELRKDLKKYPIEEIDEKSAEPEILHILSKYGIQPGTSNQQAVTITLWGTGKPFREFLYVDDVADACIFLMQNINFTDLKAFSSSPSALYSEPGTLCPNPCALSPSPHTLSSELCALSPSPHADIKNTHINIGTGKDLTIKELADLIKDIIGFKGHLNWDSSKPDGTPRKLLDVSKINRLGWKERIRLEDGIKLVYVNYSK